MPARSVHRILAGATDRFDIPTDPLNRVAGGERRQQQATDQQGKGLTHKGSNFQY